MRKLVKKLALVLALVLAIGCIAPASAQAAEGVRRSWNFAPGEYKPTLEMTVDENYTLEALDYEAAMNYSIYDVAYYSYNTDALEVSMETGYAVAKAAAENVKIKAVVLNKETGNTASFWGFVDIAEKEVVATATPTATVAPTVAPLAISKVEQKSINSFDVTFNRAAKDEEFAISDFKVYFSTVTDTDTKIVSYIKSIVFNEDKTVATVTMYNQLIDKTYIFVNYAGDEEVFQAETGDVAKVVIVTDKALVNTDHPVTVKLYNAKGIDITTDERLKDVTLEQKSGESSSISGNGIYFWEEDKTAVVVATYYSYEYTDTVVETRVSSDEYTIISVGTTSNIAYVDKWTANNNTDWNKASVHSIKVGAAANKIVARGYYVDPIKGSFEKINITASNAEDLKIRFESGDPSKLLVASDGTIYPIAAGTVNVALYQDESLVAIFPVEVKTKSTPSTLDITKNKNILSNTTATTDTVAITVTVRDQHTDQIDTTIHTAKFASTPKLSDGTSAAPLKVETSKNTVTVYGNDGGVAAYPGTYVLEVTYKNGNVTLTKKIAFEVKNPGEEVRSYLLEVNNSKYEEKIENGETVSGTDGAHERVITAYKLGDYGGKIDETAILGMLPDDLTTAVNNGLYVKISGADKKAKDFFTLDEENDTIVFNRFKVVDGKVIRAAAGTYTITLCVVIDPEGSTPAYTRDYNSVAINVKEKNDTYSASLKTVASDVKYSEAVSGSSLVLGKLIDAVVDCYQFKKGSSNLSDSQETGLITAVDCSWIPGSNEIYVKSVTLTVEMTIDNAKVKYNYDIAINHIIELK